MKIDFAYGRKFTKKFHGGQFSWERGWGRQFSWGQFSGRYSSGGTFPGGIFPRTVVFLLALK